MSEIIGTKVTVTYTTYDADGNEMSESTKEISKVLTKRTFIGPVAKVTMGAELAFSKQYGNKGGISIMVSMPCYPNEVKETIGVVEGILENTMAEKGQVLREAVNELLEADSAPKAVKTKKKAAAKKKPAAKKKKAAEPTPEEVVGEDSPF